MASKASKRARAQEAYYSSYAPKPKPKPRSSPKPNPVRIARATERAYATPKYSEPRPTPKQVQVARAQERYYKSQGEAVEKGAHVQRRRGLGKPSGGAGLTTYKEAKAAGHDKQAARILKTRQGRRANREKVAARIREERRITKLVGFNPRERYDNTGSVTKQNVMPVPDNLKKAKELGYLETDPNKLKAAGFKTPGWLEEAVSSPKYAIKALSNAPKDTLELAVGTPTSLVHMGATELKGVTESVKRKSLKPVLDANVEVAKGVIEPYKQLVKDPLKFATEHPVTTGLMVAPTAKVPMRAAGRAARVAGKQTLRREPAHLPGTSLKVQRTGSRSMTKRAKQARRDEGRNRLGERTREAPAPARVSTERSWYRPTSELDRRVDEFFDVGQQHKQAAVASATKQVNKTAPYRRVRPPAVRKSTRKQRATQKAEFGAQVEEKLSGARAGAQQHVDREFAREFGSHWRVERPGKTKLKKTGETEKTIKHPEPPSREAYIAERPKPAHGDPDPTVEGLTENVKPGKSGISIEREYIRQVDPHTREHVGWGRQVPGHDDKVVVARDANGKPIGALKMIVDEHGQPTIMEVAVDPAHRGKGIASKLIKAAHDAGYDVAKAAREGGLTEAGAALVHKNLAARAAGAPLATLKIGHYKPKTKKGERQVVEPRNAPEGSGVIHANRKDAQAVADAIAERGLFTPKVIEIEGATAGKTRGFAVVPEQAAERLRHHGDVGTSPATGAVVFRVGSRQFRKTVLPVSTKWLGGQAVEAVVRSAAQGAGPASLLRYRRVMKELKRVDPDAARALEQRALSGGQFGVTGPAAEFASKGKTMAEEFKPTGLAEAAKVVTRAGALPGPKQARAAYRKYADFVFNDVNGRIEGLAKKGMLGKEIGPRGSSPLMERRLIGLGEKAVAEAAQGLRGTSSQVEAARAVNRAYGKYAQMNPHARERILHTTPFIPWFVNMANFLTRVMPADHPVKTALVASMNQGDQEWRKSKRLSYYGKDRVPDWMMGAYPAGKDKFVPVGRFGPFAPGEYIGSLGSQVFPQFSGTLLNLAGVDWKGQELKGGRAGQHDLASNAALSQAEALIPGFGLANRITGLGDRYVRGKTDKPSVGKGKQIDKAILDMLNPVRPIGLAAERSSKRKKPKPGFSSGGSKGGFNTGPSQGGFK